MAARSRSAPVTAILNLRGRKENSGCTRRPLAQDFGVRARIGDLVGRGAGEMVGA